MPDRGPDPAEPQAQEKQGFADGLVEFHADEGGGNRREAQEYPGKLEGKPPDHHVKGGFRVCKLHILP
ncbi:MAG: hypothetical protein WC343_14735, partial [Bacilli bacterium]